LVTLFCGTALPVPIISIAIVFIMTNFMFLSYSYY
jgi:hypothetical protein